MDWFFLLLQSSTLTPIDFDITLSSAISNNFITSIWKFMKDNILRHLHLENIKALASLNKRVVVITQRFTGQTFSAIYDAWAVRRLDIYSGVGLIPFYSAQGSIKSLSVGT